MGMSLSTDPSIHRCGDGSQGTASPVLGSLASSDAAVYTNGTEHEAALRYVSELGADDKRRSTYTADQMRTLGAVT